VFAPVPSNPSPPLSTGGGGGFAPNAQFVGTPLSGPATLTVNFTDLSSSSPTSWLWTFGDGDTSTSQNPTHDYLTAGLYTVSLQATNATGTGSITKTDYITVTGSPVVVTTDTHDGFDSNRKREDEERRKKEELRYLIQHAIDPQAFPWPLPEPAQELAEEVSSVEDGRIEIDWKRIERENTLRAQLYAMAAEHERLRREFEEDEEDVILLLH